jgi:hypothetical protein
MNDAVILVAIVVWFGLALFAGNYAQSKGYSTTTFAVISVLFIGSAPAQATIRRNCGEVHGHELWLVRARSCLAGEHAFNSYERIGKAGGWLCRHTQGTIACNYGRRPQRPTYTHADLVALPIEPE